MKVLHVFTITTTPKAFFDGQFKFLAENGIENIVVANTIIDEEFRERNQVQGIECPIERRISPISDLKAINSLVANIHRLNPDIIVGHTPKGAMVAMIAGKLAGVKRRVYYRHGYIYTTATGVKRILLKSIEKLTSTLATNILNVSPSIGEIAVEDGLNKVENQSVIGLGTCGGIDTREIFNPALCNEEDINTFKKSLGISKDDFIVGFAGRLCKDKGIVELIDGFRVFRSNNPHIKAKLLLLGPYDERDVLPDNVKEEISNSVDIISTGNVDKKDIFKYYALMDLFVFPSHREGFGMCVIEASAMEVPVLVSKSHGCVDSIKEHISGEYIELSADGVAKGIEMMLKNPKLKDYGKNGREWVCNNFDSRVLWPKILDMYKSWC